MVQSHLEPDITFLRVCCVCVHARVHVQVLVLTNRLDNKGGAFLSTTLLRTPYCTRPVLTGAMLLPAGTNNNDKDAEEGEGRLVGPTNTLCDVWY